VIGTIGTIAGGVARRTGTGMGAIEAETTIGTTGTAQVAMRTGAAVAMRGEGAGSDETITGDER